MDFVIFSTADWDHPSWTNKQHVAACLADLGHRILYVESMGIRRPSATVRDAARIRKRLGKLVSGMQHVRENVWVMSPFSIPFQGNHLIRSLNLTVLRWQIIRSLHKLNMLTPIFWTYNPLLGNFLDMKYWMKSVYHCVDEISEQPGMPIQLVREQEKELLQKVNRVFVTSVRLLEEKKIYNPNMYYLPNVVDFDHFHQTLTEKSLKIPEDLDAISEPRVGFIGALSSYKVDFDLLYQVALRMPNHSFVLIGDVGEGDPYTNVGKLKELGNVYFLGHRPYARLPEYLKGIQVCLLPFHLNRYTEYMFPMKFFEYLAAGRPVVGRKLPSLKSYTDHYIVASTVEEFVEGINQCIGKSELVESLKTAGIELARKNTYRQRTLKMLEIMESGCSGENS